jgi:hypothetical protein
MKRFIYTISATTAVWAAVVFGLVFFNQVYILIPSEAESIIEVFKERNILIDELYKALVTCKMS